MCFADEELLWPSSDANGGQGASACLLLVHLLLQLLPLLQFLMA
jgi:hypothetical protein